MYNQLDPNKLKNNFRLYYLVHFVFKYLLHIWIFEMDYDYITTNNNVLIILI